MKIYLFRHAQKAMDFSGDPDLTAEGHAQASKVLDKVLKNELPQPTELWVSPKKRTHSTFRPVSQHFGLPMQINEALLEQQGDENLSDFRSRIEKLFEGAAARKEGVIFLCSHYDLVVEAMSVLPSDKDLTDSEFSHWSPCQYIGFEVNSDGIYEFLEFKKVQL
ncbi:phosphoglycerate mutase family protein [Bdellovibrio sp. HCB-110]|uniref:phosphoglycerate mutase family protein n=1 Tax=Bdellovibrio sp. HCB-110 TaxID=3391182 RepID=UPI0039B3D0D1